jgi:hypothetical protein
MESRQTLAERRGNARARLCPFAVRCGHADASVAQEILGVVAPTIVEDRRDGYCVFAHPAHARGLALESALRINGRGLEIPRSVRRLCASPHSSAGLADAHGFELAARQQELQLGCQLQRYVTWWMADMMRAVRYGCSVSLRFSIATNSAMRRALVSGLTAV